jgi:hypothetical protein
MWFDNYSVFVLIADDNLPEAVFWKQVNRRAKEVGAETIIFFAEPEEFFTAYLIAPATDKQREQRIFIPFKQAFSFILSREGYSTEDNENAEEVDLPLLYIERVKETDLEEDDE